MVNLNYSRKCKFQKIYRLNRLNLLFISLVGQINSNRLLLLSIQYLIIIYKKYQIHRFGFVIIFFITFTIFLLFTIHNKPKNNDTQVNEALPTHIFYANTSNLASISNIQQQSYRFVLLWTDLFKNIHWHQPAFFNSSTIISCTAKHQCQFTRDKRKLSQASVVAFHLYDMTRSQLPERISTKNDNQSWVFITGESPINFYYQNPSFVPYVLDNYFDRSISYRYDSPFPVFLPLIKSRNLSSNQIQHERQLNLDSLKMKKKPIAWIVSNCITFSQREKYIKELNKFIQIDIYGKCGTPCSGENNSQCKMSLSEYYFYLSFENSHCKSYITEKFWNIISDNTHRLVPIVMGAEESDYQRIAPKQSYIHVNQYKTPEDLAKYLNYLINDSGKYLTYLQWREHTEIQMIKYGSWTTLLCPLCEMAYEVPVTSSTRLNFTSWFNPTIDCHYDDVQMFRKCKQADLGGWMSLIHGMKCP